MSAGRILLIVVVLANLGLGVSLLMKDRPEPPDQKPLVQIDQSLRLVTEDSKRPESLSPEVAQRRAPLFDQNVHDQNVHKGAEKESDKGMVASNRPARRNQPSPQEPAPMACRAWEPQTSPEEFKQLVAELQTAGIKPVVEEVEVTLEPRYMVVVRGLGSREVADATAQALGEDDIDNYVMFDDQEPVVSVGLFSSQRLALNQHQVVSGLGYEVEVQAIERIRNRFVLSANVPLDSPFFESSITSCEAIAQSN